MNGFFQQIIAFAQRLPLRQRMAIGGVILGGVVVLGSVAYWANQPDFALLFGNLSQADAGEVVESLQGRGVKYELRDNGSAVYVPREEVYELRIALAGDGVVTEGPDGYELFDRGTLGMTDFMQRLNMKRALEGELSRTISSLRQVKLARVHLVMPERSPFRETQVQPSASVVIQFEGGNGLSLSQIDGIASLVAGAVEGLEPTEVTVLDTQGNVLSSAGDEDDQVTLSSTQLEVQRTVEENLTVKGQSMLDEVLGAGHSIVRISASLDFSRTISNRELIDPESATVISEEKIDERLNETSGANSSVRNYDLSRTTETHEKSVGSIDFLTVSVILNQKPLPPPANADPDAEPAEPTYREYTAQELADIEALVQNAVGFDPDRGDRIALHQTRFETANPTNPLLDELEALEQSDRIANYLRYGLIALALVFAFLLVRRAGRQVTELRDPSRAGQLAGGYFDSNSRLVTGGGTGAIGGGAAGPALTAARGGADGRSMDDMFADGMSEDEAAILGAERQLTSGDGHPLYADKLEIEARTEDPLFDQVRRLVAASPDDAAAAIREWISKGPLAI